MLEFPIARIERVVYRARLSPRGDAVAHGGGIAEWVKDVCGNGAPPAPPERYWVIEDAAASG